MRRCRPLTQKAWAEQIARCDASTLLLALVVRAGALIVRPASLMMGCKGTLHCALLHL